MMAHATIVLYLKRNVRNPTIFMMALISLIIACVYINKGASFYFRVPEDCTTTLFRLPAKIGDQSTQIQLAQDTRWHSVQVNVTGPKYDQPIQICCRLRIGECNASREECTYDSKLSVRLNYAAKLHYSPPFVVITLKASHIPKGQYLIGAVQDCRRAYITEGIANVVFGVASLISTLKLLIQT